MVLTETRSRPSAPAQTTPSARTSRPLRIVHCLRAPVGGLFRHVRDLARGQALGGNAVGVICDANAQDALTAKNLAELQRFCALGIHLVPMHRQIAPSDFWAIRKTRDLCAAIGPDILHGHGAKGGAFARLAALRTNVLAFYTPHGGSLHYSPRSPAGFVFLRLERLLAQATSGLIFESVYGRDTFMQKIAQPECPVQVIHNGLHADEFKRVTPGREAADFLFIGELRDLKGLDLLLEALARIRTRHDARATIVGDGPDAARFHQMARDLGLDGAVEFTGAMPARDGFKRGQVLVVPSRAESFPYIVLEALAARVPVIATRVGGIPEMFGEWERALVTPDNCDELEEAMQAALTSPQQLHQQAEALAGQTRAAFSAERMTTSVEAFYRSELADAAQRGLPAR